MPRRKTVSGQGNGRRRSRDSIKNVWGKRTPYQGKWKERIDENMEQEPEAWIQAACVLCSTGCGLDIGGEDRRIIAVRAVDRVNHVQPRVPPKAG